MLMVISQNLAGPGFRAAVDCARGMNPVRADLPLLVVLRPDLLPLLVMVPSLPRRFCADRVG
ncbi:hypothetical protein FF36_04623 [Frankia torreyi]|uniref:Uncharacterized protein n=2 Tax=Frankia torreyi TaxID=1856 RepID=A0A0D8BA08_9ACTN|nr:hypothetical protein FF36_04623 [Frankia torreyi]